MKYKGIPINDIVIYKHPIVYLQLAAYAFVDLLKWFKDILIKRVVIILLGVFFWILVNKVTALNVHFYPNSQSNNLLSLHFIGSSWVLLHQLGQELDYTHLFCIQVLILRKQPWLQLHVVIYQRCFQVDGILITSANVNVFL